MKKHERRSSILGLGGGKEEIKCQFDIIIKQVSGVPKSITSPILFQWKRGSKKENSGQCPAVNISDEREANFNHSFSLICTLHKDPKKGFEEKNLVFDLREDKGKKSNSIGKVPINLAEFAISRSERVRTFSIRDKKSAVASVILSFKTTWLKMNGKKLVKATDAPTQGGNVVQLDGNDYYLQTDTDDVSVADDKSDSDVEDAESFKDDDDEGNRRASMRLAPLTEVSDNALTTSTPATAPAPAPVATPRAVEPAPAPTPAPAPVPVATPRAVEPTPSPAKSDKKSDKGDKGDKDKTPEEKARKYKKKCKAMIKDLADLKKENDVLKANLKQKEAVAQGGNAEQQAKVDELNKKVAAGQASEKELQVKITALEAKVAASGDKDKQITTLKEDAARSQKESKDIEEGLRKKVKEVSDKQTESQRELEKKTKALQDAEKRIKEIEKGSSALDSLKSANLDLQARLDIMEVQNEQKEKETQAQIVQLSTQLDTAKKAAAEQEKRSADASKDDEALKSRVKKLEEELEAAKKESEKSAAEAKDSQAKVIALTADLDKVSGTTTSKDSEVAKLRMQLAEAKATAKAKDDANALAKTDAAGATAELEGQVQELQAKVDKKVAKKRELKKQLAMVNADVAEMNKKVSESEGKDDEVDQLKIEMRTLKAQLERSDAESADNKVKAEHFELCNQKMKEDFTKQLEDSTSCAAELDAQNKSLNAKITELAAENRLLLAKVDELELKNKAVATKTSDLEAQNKSYSTKTAELEAQNVLLIAKIATLENDLSSAQGDQTSRAADKDSDKKKIVALEEQLAAAKASEKKKVSALEEELAAAKEGDKKKISTLEEELAAATSASVDLKEELIQEKSKAKELEEQNSELEEKLAKAKEKAKDDSDEDSEDEDMQQQIEELEDEIDSLKQKVNRKTTEIEILEEEKSELQKRINEFETNLASPPTSKKDQKKLNALEEERDALHKRIAELESGNPASTPGNTTNGNAAALEEERDELLIKVKQLEIEQAKAAQQLSEVEEDKENLARELAKQKAANASPQVKRAGTPEVVSSNGSSEDATVLAKVEAAVYWPEIGFGSSSHEGNTSTAIIQLLNSSHAFESPSSYHKSLIKKLIVAIDKSFKRAANDDKMVVYWLSNICTLLKYLNQQADVSPSADPSLSGIQTDPSQFITESADLADNFARELQDIVLRVYTQLVSSFRRQLVPLLLDAMLREESSVVLNGPSPRKTSPVSVARATSNGGPVQSIGPFILQVINMLSGAHYMIREAHVPDAVLRQFFNHILSFIDGYVLNSLLSGDEACTASTGVQMKMGVSRIDEWLSKPDNQVISPTGERLNDLREAANVLVLDKSIFLDSDSITAIFHSLNLVQIKKLLELFRPDGMSPTPVPSSVRKMMDAYWGYSVTPASLPLLRDVSSLNSTF